MPVLLRSNFCDGDEHDIALSELLAIARRLVDADHPGFREAGRALDAQNPCKAAHDWLRARRARYEMEVGGQMSFSDSPGPTSTVSPAETAANASDEPGRAPWAFWMRNPRRGDNLLGERLLLTIADFLRRNREGELLRALGKHLPTRERKANARRAIVLGLATLDPDATDYLGDLTDLAKAPWVGSADSRRPVLGRSDVCRWFHRMEGHPCLELLREAIGILMPTPTSDQMGSDSKVASKPGSISKETSGIDKPSTTGGREPDAEEHAKPNDPTMDDLASEVGISDDTIRRVREAAGISTSLRGWTARDRRYPPKEVDRLIEAALAGNFNERRAMAEKWAKWSSKSAAGQPHDRKSAASR